MRIGSKAKTTGKPVAFVLFDCPAALDRHILKIDPADIFKVQPGGVVHAYASAGHLL